MSNQLKVIVNQKAGIADIYLYGSIGSFDNGNKIDGDYVAQLIRSYDDSGIKIIKEHINSDGGEITNGLSIVAANFGCVNSQVYTYNEGVAASMAGIIHQTGSKKFASSYSQFMMHEPSMSGETIATTTDEIVKKRLQSAKDQLITILTEATGMTSERIDQMMTQETWLNAKQCEAMGFVTKGCVMNGLSIINNESPKELMILVNKAYNNLNNSTMAKVKCEKCGEEFDFPEGKDVATCPGCKTKVDEKGKKVAKNENELKTETMVDKVTFDKLSDQITSLTNLVTGLTKENQSLKSESEANKKAVTEAILNKAIEQGKIMETAKDSFLTDYALNPDGLKKIVDSIPMPHNSINSVIDKTKDEMPLPDGYKTLREFEKNAPAKAEKFAIDFPTAYEKLYKKEYAS